MECIGAFPGSTWGIRQFHTGFLIDPEEKIEPQGDLPQLERKLQELVQAKPDQTGSK
jgi:hypothetical protein